MNTIIKKLKKLRDENPALVDAIEKEFPEIIDKTPFITSNTLFMKKENVNTLYQLSFRNNVFTIINLSYNKTWKGDIKPSNIHECTSISDYYLNQSDFKKLLKKSYVKLNNLRIINNTNLSLMYRNLFNNEI